MGPPSGEPQISFFLSNEAQAAGLNFKPPRPRDAGFDLVSLGDITLEPGQFTLIRTGLHLAIPDGWVGLIRDRSSVALRGGMTVAGVIDAAYRGEVKIAIYNFGVEPLTFSSGERVAQCVVVPHLRGENTVEAHSLDALGESERGMGGFGSTGR